MLLGNMVFIKETKRYENSIAIKKKKNTSHTTQIKNTTTSTTLQD